MRYFAIVIFACLCGCRNTQTRQVQDSIDPPQHSSLDTRSGRLGYPLGTDLTVEGFRSEGKGTRHLLVDTISGKQVGKPIVIDVDNVHRPLPPSPSDRGGGDGGVQACLLVNAVFLKDTRLGDGSEVLISKPPDSSTTVFS